MELLIILVLIILNGVFSMSEIAVISSRTIRLEAAVKAGKTGARTALHLASSPTRFLSTVQIGITLIGLLTGIYSGENITNDMENWLAQFEQLRPFADGLAVALVLLIITFCSLLLGELVPKRIGLSNPEVLAMRFAPFMKLLSTITSPFVWILSKTSDLILIILNIKPPKKNQITEEEIKAIIQEGAQGGEVQQIEQEIVERVFSLGDRKISSLMILRSDLAFIDINSDADAIRDIVTTNFHPLYPVHENNKDKILGIVSLRDLLNILKSGDDIRSVIRVPPLFVESTTAYKALEKFRQSKIHYALVLEEYGSVLGIVTLDNILRALVGDISDLDAKANRIDQLSDGSWLIDGQFPFADFVLHFDVEDTSYLDHINTLGGLILSELNTIPTVGEKLVWKGLELQVFAMDNVKIKRVRVKKL